MNGIEYYPVEVLRKEYNWKDKRTIIGNLQKLGVRIIRKGGKAWFSVNELNRAFTIEEKVRKKMGYQPKSEFATLDYRLCD
ncbi:hypothetical protein JMN32_05005 [Fulvivirga sp. 29W222]|uniref:Uncharacterized protein n=1 Tax=Fulvivirga marina TaxID=2494733 RepID=A0A937KD43_9BACT|nr:hypothetical protein [Fulvivirga marina]MBL6445655.1 hypothetical protein [Fulvivirga marina]